MSVPPLSYSYYSCPSYEDGVPKNSNTDADKGVMILNLGTSKILGKQVRKQKASIDSMEMLEIKPSETYAKK